MTLSTVHGTHHDEPPDERVLFTDSCGSVMIRKQVVSLNDDLLHAVLTHGALRPAWQAVVRANSRGTTVQHYSVGGNPFVEIIDCDGEVRINCFGMREPDNFKVYGALREWAQATRLTE